MERVWGKNRSHCRCSFQKDTKPDASQRSTAKGRETMVIVVTIEIARLV